VAGGQLADRLVDAARRGNVLAFEVERQRVEVERVRQPRKRPQRLQLRSERERSGMPRVVERLDPEMIAGEEQLAPRAIPQREREHPGQPVQRAPRLSSRAPALRRRRW
jgi:hypothetical protein